MGEFIVSAMVFFAVMAIAAVLFCVWMAMVVARGVGMVMSWLGLGGRRCEIRGAAPVERRCGFELCRAISAEDARYCRRCGRLLPAVRQAEVRRVAMW